MPVRTDRGRVAVYRKIWGWPLRSPRHLAVTAAAALVAVGAVALLAAAIGGRPSPATAVPSTTTSTPRTTTAGAVPPAEATTADTTTTTVPSMVSTTAQAPVTVSPPTPELTGPAAASAVAGEFMGRWVIHPAGMTSRQWADQLAPYVVPEYLVELESVEPSNIPATAVTSPPVVTSTTPTVVEVDVATNGGVVHLVVLAQRDGTWLVRSYDLAAS